MASSSRAVPEPLDFALIARLREASGDTPVTEAELRTLSERADAWARTLHGQIEGSERRLRQLHADPESSLAEIASELRRVEMLRPQLTEVRGLLDDLERRARALRTSWLLHQAESTRPLSAGKR